LHTRIPVEVGQVGLTHNAETRVIFQSRKKKQVH